MGPGHLGGHLQQHRFRTAQNARADLGVPVHHVELFVGQLARLVENGVRDAELADVVHLGRIRQPVGPRVGPARAARQQYRVRAHALEVSGGVTVLGFGGEAEAQHHLAVCLVGFLLRRLELHDRLLEGPGAFMHAGFEHRVHVGELALIRADAKQGLNSRLQLDGFRRFANEVVGAEIDGPLARVGRPLRRHHAHGGWRAGNPLAHPLQEFEAIHHRHAQVQNDQVDALAIEHVQRLEAIRGFDEAQVLPAQHTLDRCADGVLVIDQQNGRRHVISPGLAECGWRSACPCRVRSRRRCARHAA